MHHDVAVSPFHTVIEIANGAIHGTCESESEVAACHVFAGLRPDQVEVRPSVPILDVCTE